MAVGIVVFSHGYAGIECVEYEIVACNLVVFIKRVVTGDNVSGENFWYGLDFNKQNGW